jgi:hypothetical protein
VIYQIETSVEYTCKLIGPVVRGQTKAVVVKEEAEREDWTYIAQKQSEMVWHKDVGRCNSWVTPVLKRGLMVVF